MLLVTGANGFVGSAVVHLALQRNIPVRAMVREASDLTLLEGSPKEIQVCADMDDAASLERAIEGITAVVHCAATTSTFAPDLELSRKVNVEGTRALLQACRTQGVTRFINISSQSAHPDNPSVYGKTKLEQDEVVRGETQIDWTILRPSIIYGPVARGIFNKMVGLCRKLPVIPVIGSGREPMRPLHVEDLAEGILQCIEAPATFGKSYDLGGADSLEFNQFLKEILQAIGQKKMLIHLPIPIALVIAHVLSTFLKNPPLTPDNVTGISTVQYVDITDAHQDFGFKPRLFYDGISKCLSADNN